MSACIWFVAIARCEQICHVFPWSCVTYVPPVAIEMSKRSIRQALELPMREAMQYGWDLLRAHREHPDALEGPKAFAEKRKPNWQNK